MRLAGIDKQATYLFVRVEDDMKRNFGGQKGENNRLQQQITLLKQEKTNLQQNLLCKHDCVTCAALQRRIADLEMQVGNDES